MKYRIGNATLSVFEPKVQAVFTPGIRELQKFYIQGVIKYGEDRTIVDCDIKNGRVVIPDHVAEKFTKKHRGKNVLTRKPSSTHVLVNVQGGTIPQIGRSGNTGKQSVGFCQLAVLPNGDRPDAFQVPVEKIKIYELGPRAMVMRPSIVCVRAIPFFKKEDEKKKGENFFDVSIVQYELTSAPSTDDALHTDIGLNCKKTVLFQTTKGTGISITSRTYDEELEKILTAAGLQHFVDPAIYAVEAASVWDWEYSERPQPLSPELEEIIIAIRNGDETAEARWSAFPLFCRAKETAEVAEEKPQVVPKTKKAKRGSKT